MIGIRTSKSQRRFSRRSLLKTMGVSAAFLPLIEAERALGATTPSGAPKRLVTITWTNGMPSTTFWPTSETDPTASQVLMPLAPLASKVLLAAGVDVKVMLDGGHSYDGHFSYSSLWTGTYKNVSGQFATAAGPSLDQAYSDFVARTVNLPIPVMSLSLIGAGQYTGVTSHRSDGTPNTAETSPTRLFNQFFNVASTAQPPAQAASTQLRQKSLLDHVQTSLQGFSARLGTADQAKIAAHLDSIRELELQLTATSMTSPSTGAACTKAATPSTATDFQTTMKSFLDLTAVALRCDMTRAVSMVWGADGGSGPGSWPFLGEPGDYHGIAHQGAAGYTAKTKIDNWYYTQVAYLAQALDSTAESGGTVLDNSVIGVTTDMNEGASHYVGRLPFVLIGSAGGYLKTGQVAKLGNWAGKTGTYWNADSGVANNLVLATLGNALGMPTGNTFGAANYPGVLPQLKA
jgi:hypothetical protein